MVTIVDDDGYIYYGITDESEESEQNYSNNEHKNKVNYFNQRNSYLLLDSNLLLRNSLFKKHKKHNKKGR
jgi:hypothetical protein